MGASTSRTGSFPAHVFLDLVLQEVRAHASDAEEQAFLRGVGERLATMLPIEAQGDLSAVAASVNEVWQAFALGSATIALEGGTIRIHHQLREPAPGQQMREFAAALPHILHGAYDGWMRALGSKPPLRTTLVSAGPEMIEFKHGL